MTFLLLQIAYAANIFILAPVLVSMYSDGRGKAIRAFQKRVDNSDGLRLLVASVWTAILLLSIAGLFAPDKFIVILIFQVIYKAIYLITYVIPTFLREGAGKVPLGLSLSFIAIVAVWPLIIWQAMM